MNTITIDPWNHEAPHNSISKMPQLYHISQIQLVTSINVSVSNLFTWFYMHVFFL